MASTSTWTILRWKGAGGTAAELMAEVEFDEGAKSGVKPIKWRVMFGEKWGAEISAEDAKILLASKGGDHYSDD